MIQTTTNRGTNNDTQTATGEKPMNSLEQTATQTTTQKTKIHKEQQARQRTLTPRGTKRKTQITTAPCNGMQYANGTPPTDVPKQPNDPPKVQPRFNGHNRCKPQHTNNNLEE